MHTHHKAHTHTLPTHSVCMNNWFRCFIYIYTYPIPIRFGVAAGYVVYAATQFYPTHYIEHHNEMDGKAQGWIRNGGGQVVGAQVKTQDTRLYHIGV